MNNIEIGRSRLKRLLPNGGNSGTYDLGEAIAAVVEESILGDETADFEWLIVDCSCFDDLAALQQMTNLKRLELTNCKREQFPIICGLEGLETLEAQGILPPGFFLDATLPRLKRLSLSNCHVPDLEGANRLTKLEELELDNSVFFNEVLNGLEGITSLKSVSLYDCPVSAIAPLRDCRELRCLDLGWSSFNDLSTLACHPRLEFVSLNGCPVTEIGPISELAILKELDLSGTKPASLSPISEHKTLRLVNLSFCELPDVAPLAKITRQLDVVVDLKRLTFWQRRKLKRARNIRIVQHIRGMP